MESANATAPTKKSDADPFSSFGPNVDVYDRNHMNVATAISSTKKLDSA